MVADVVECLVVGVCCGVRYVVAVPNVVDVVVEVLAVVVVVPSVGGLVSKVAVFGVSRNAAEFVRTLVGLPLWDVKARLNWSPIIQDARNPMFITTCHGYSGRTRIHCRDKAQAGYALSSSLAAAEDA